MSQNYDLVKLPFVLRDVRKLVKVVFKWIFMVAIVGEYLKYMLIFICTTFIFIQYAWFFQQYSIYKYYCFKT